MFAPSVSGAPSRVFRQRGKMPHPPKNGALFGRCGFQPRLGRMASKGSAEAQAKGVRKQRKTNRRDRPAPSLGGEGHADFPRGILFANNADAPNQLWPLFPRLHVASGDGTLRNEKRTEHGNGNQGNSNPEGTGSERVSPPRNCDGKQVCQSTEPQRPSQLQAGPRDSGQGGYAEIALACPSLRTTARFAN